MTVLTGVAPFPTVPRGTTARTEARPPIPAQLSLQATPREVELNLLTGHHQNLVVSPIVLRCAVLMRFGKAARRSSSLYSESKIIIQGLMLLWMATWACRVDVEQMFVEPFFHGTGFRQKRGRPFSHYLSSWRKIFDRIWRLIKTNGISRLISGLQRGEGGPSFNGRPGPFWWRAPLALWLTTGRVLFALWNIGSSLWWYYNGFVGVAFFYRYFRKRCSLLMNTRTERF